MHTTYINIVLNTDNSPSYFGDCTSQGTLVLPEKTALIVVTLTAANGAASIDSFSFSPTSSGVGVLSSLANIPGVAVGLIEVDFSAAPGGQLSFSLTASINGGSPIPIQDPTIINVDPPIPVIMGDASARRQEELPAKAYRAA